MLPDGNYSPIACAEILDSRRMVMIGEYIETTVGNSYTFAERDFCQKNITEVFDSFTSGICKNEKEGYIPWEMFQDISFSGIKESCGALANQVKRGFNNKFYCGSVFSESRDSPKVLGAIGRLINQILDYLRTAGGHCISELRDKLVKEDVCAFPDYSGNIKFFPHVLVFSENFKPDRNNISNPYFSETMRAFSNFSENCQQASYAVARLQEYIDGMQGKTDTVTTAGINLIHQMSATDDDSHIFDSLFSKEVFFSFGFGLGCVFICSLSTIVIWVKNRVCRKNEKYADILKQSGTAKQAGRFP